MSKKLAVCRLAREAPIPDWVLSGELFAVARTPDELSVVCAEQQVVPGGGFNVEGGWVALKLEGPFPFSMAGVLASFIEPLAKAKIPIFAISTFDTDYVLVKSADLERTVAALGTAGHREIG